MTKVRVPAFGISLDGYGAGPDQALANPMGVGGMALHNWVMGTKTMHEMMDFAKSLLSGEPAREDVDDKFAARGFQNMGAWIMGRNMFTPNLWGEIYYFNDGDVDFLSQLMKWSKGFEPLLTNRRTILGDPWHNDVYGYAYGSGQRSVIFANNMHFASRRAHMRLNDSVGIEAEKGTRLNIITHFPDRTKVTRPDGLPFAAGDALDVTLRPFETLMLEVMPAGQADASLPSRNVAPDLGQLGVPVGIERVEPAGPGQDDLQQARPWPGELEGLVAAIAILHGD